MAAYLCGHEHNLQHLHADGETTHYIVSGAHSLPVCGCFFLVAAQLPVGRLADHHGTPSRSALRGAGGGSKTDYHQHPPAQAEQRLFLQGSGFVACELTKRALSCQYYGIGTNTTALYSVSIEH